MTKIFDLYTSRGFVVVELITDLEFECIRDDILPIKLTTIRQDKHLGDIEQSIRDLKDRIRCIVQLLPYPRYTKLMMTEMGGEVCQNKNQLPEEDGVLKNMSAMTTIFGHP